MTIPSIRFWLTMWRLFRICHLVFMALSISGVCAFAQSPAGTGIAHANISWRSLAKAQKNTKIPLSKEVFIEKIEEGAWLHVSSKSLPGVGPVPSNGLIIRSGAKVLLVDTAWNDEQTKLILDWIEKELGAKPAITIVTHHHEDRLGGIKEVHHRGIRTLASALTARLAREQGLVPPQQTFEGRINLTLGTRRIQVEYAGPGHAVDNIVVWIPDRKILFGGCLVKSAAAKDLGNTKDAVMKQWPKTIAHVTRQFKQASIVIPGHGDIGGVETLKHTLGLLRKANTK